MLVLHVKRLRTTVLTAIYTLGVASLFAAQTNPNIIMIYTDDMGYSDISSFATTPLPVRTPNIDRLANEGMKFTRFYVSMPICSPSRAAVLSGRYAPTNRLTNYLQERVGNFQSDQNDYMDPARSYLPKTFQTAGYATGHVGKWHLGGGRDVDNPPSIRLYGYDEAYSTWESPNPDPKLGVKFTPWNYNNLEPGQFPRHQRTEYMVDKTLDFLQRHPEKPCFVTLWPDDVHTPFTPNAAMKAKYGGISGQDNSRENFYGVLEEYDRQIGRLIDGVAAQGKDNDTIIFFTGDNGPAPDYGTERTNGMNGGKLSLYEGGVRQPFLIRWPGHIPAGSSNSQTVMSAVDLLPTLASLAGISLSPEAQLGMDGEDLSAAMLGGTPARSNPIFWEYGRTTKIPRPGASDVDRSPILAMLDGNFKLLMDPNGTNKELYNVATNPNENNNIAASNASRVQTMSTALLAWNATLPHRDHPYPLYSQVNFNQYAITRLASAANLQAAAGAAATVGIDGVAAAPNGIDYVYAIHNDGLQNTFLQIDVGTEQISRIANSDQITGDLGAGGSNLELVSGFEYSLAGDRLFFGEKNLTQNGINGIVSLNIGTTSASLIASGGNLTGLSDHAVLPNGSIAIVRDQNGNRSVGTIDAPNGAWTQRVSENQLKTASAGTTNLPPVSIGVNNALGESMVFAQGDSDLFSITNLMSGTPAITRQTQPLLATLDARDITMDQAGNTFIYDISSGLVIVIRAGDGGLFGVRLSDIASALGVTGTIAPTEWRALSARMFDADHADLFIASSNPGVGIVKVRFGNFSSNVDDWSIYD